jgi:hypothetical protein
MMSPHPISLSEDDMFCKRERHVHLIISVNAVDALFVNGNSSTYQLAPGKTQADIDQALQLVNNLQKSTDRRAMKQQLALANALAAIAKVYPNGDTTQQPYPNITEADLAAAQKALFQFSWPEEKFGLLTKLSAALQAASNALIQKGRNDFICRFKVYIPSVTLCCFLP